MGERIGVVVVELGDVEQQRPRRHEQPDRPVDGIDARRQIVVDGEVDEIDERVERRPRRERKERRTQLDTSAMHEPDGLGGVGGGVALVEDRQDAIVDALEGGCDEQAAEGGQLGPHLSVTEDQLDLGGDVEREVGVELVDGTHDPERMVHAIEKVGIGEREVLGTHGNELVDVGEHGRFLHDAHSAVVDRGNGTVPAARRTTMACLDCADQTLGSIDAHARVSPEGRQQVARREPEPLPTELDRRSGGVALDPLDERGLVLAGDGPIDGVGGGRRIKPVRACPRPAGDRREDIEREARRRVRGHGDGDGVDIVDERGIPRIDREVDAPDVVTALPEHARG